MNLLHRSPTPMTVTIEAVISRPDIIPTLEVRGALCATSKYQLRPENVGKRKPDRVKTASCVGFFRFAAPQQLRTDWHIGNCLRFKLQIETGLPWIDAVGTWSRGLLVS